MRILDLKTVADPEAAKRLLALEPFSDNEALLAMTTLRVARQQAPQLPIPLRRVAAASLLRVDADRVELAEFDDADGEAALLRALEAELGETDGPVWAWDAAGHYRSLLLARSLAGSLALPRLLADGGPCSLAVRHGFAPGTAALSELAAIHGLPQALGLRAAEVEAAHAAGDRERLRAGSAADGLMACLLHLALEQSVGARSAESVAAERQRLRDWLGRQPAPHWRQFLKAWRP